MKSIGMKATIMIAGVANEADPAIGPSADARLYAGAAEATPITTLERNESAFFLRPLSLTEIDEANASGK